MDVDSVSDSAREENAVTRHMDFVHNTTFFPAYQTMDSDQDLAGSDFYEEGDHWCLLAQIEDVSTLLRIRLVVRDRDKRSLVVAFYHDRSVPFDDSQLRVGHTIAIIYARQHYFMDGSQGVRVEDLNHFCTFPARLDDIMRINKELNEYSAGIDEANNIQTCHACAQKGKNLMKCGGCLFYHYCSVDCQKVGWNDKGHKKACKVLKLPNMKALLRLNTDDYDEKQLKFSA